MAGGRRRRKGWELMEKSSEADTLLEGKNSVWEALKAERPIDRILFSKTIAQESIRGITGLARSRGVKIEFVPKEKLDAISSTGKHQGVIAVCAAQPYAELDSVLDTLETQGKTPFIVLLDEVQDPHNLGAVIRTAECAGAQAVVITQHNSAGLTPAAARASAGAAEHVPVCRVQNLARAVESLKERGIWVVGVDMQGKPAWEADLTGPVALVVGGEDGGVRRLVLEKCDFLAGLPMFGKINSLNTSVAAGILMYEVVKQRGNPHAPAPSPKD
jgi:23S rRNA (guanosine2251-2'-O)-methyltransferase